MQERNGTSKQLALEVEEEGADRTLLTMESKWRRRSKKEKNRLVHARSLSNLQWTKLAWRCRKEEGKRRGGQIQARRQDLAQLAPVLVER